MTVLSVLITILVVLAALSMMALTGYVIFSLVYNWNQRRWY